MTLTTDIVAIIVLLLIACLVLLVRAALNWLKRPKQEDPYTPEPEHQGPWGSDEMRGDSDKGDQS